MILKFCFFFFIYVNIIVSTSQISNEKLTSNRDIKIFNFNESINVDPNHLVVVNVTQFVISVKGGLEKAKYLAKKFNLKLIKKVFEDSNYFLFQQEKNSQTNFNSEDYYNGEYDDELIESNKILNRVKSKRNLKRTKRLRYVQDFDEINLLKTDPNVEWIQQQIPKKRIKRDLIEIEHAPKMIKKRDTEIHYEQNDKLKFNDPMWPKLWYINPQEKFSNSMRIKEAWELGYTGKGVVVTILDDGLEWDHPDIFKNYDSNASLDINDGDNDPRPRYDRYNYNKHGTRCAGEIAAMADNKVCSVGVAYNSKIGGIRMLDGEVTDLVEATALSFNRDYIDIYSASWGPDDDGKTVDGPGFLALKAIEDGIKYGRRGLGSIYVWASGNGGKDDDNCNCDGYTNSIYTISISSATQNGNIPWYSESCSSTIASTFSSGSYEERQIITTDLRKSCTEAHTGTSASAPLAAGIIALTLEANAELSWRDVQHIIVETSKPDNLTSSDWQLNGANRRVSHSFGYGMMDALSMIELAKKWINVPNQRKCVIESSANGHHQKPILIPKGDRLIIELYSTGCKGTKNEINYLEHVQAVISVQSNSRGTLVVYLKSPMGTNSTLLDRRMLDQSAESFNKWPFTSVHMWGEVPHGTWIVEIKNNAKNTTYMNLNLILYGTKDSPQKRSTDSGNRDEVNHEQTPTYTTDKHSNLQDNKNRKALKTEQTSNHTTKPKSHKPHKKISKLTTRTTSTTTTTTTTTTTMTTTTEEKEVVFKNKLFENDEDQGFEDDYDESSLNLNNFDYMSDKKTSEQQEDEKEEVEDDELFEDFNDNRKVIKNQLNKNGKILTHERSSIVQNDYSSSFNQVKSLSSQSKFKFINSLLSFSFFVLFVKFLN